MALVWGCIANVIGIPICTFYYHCTLGSRGVILAVSRHFVDMGNHPTITPRHVDPWTVCGVVVTFPCILEQMSLKWHSSISSMP